MSRKSSSVEARLSHLLHRAVQLAAILHADRAGPGGLTPRQYAVLSTIAGEERRTQSQIVRATGVDRSTLAELLARMDDRGWVVRTRSSGDGRSNLVALTDAGRTVLATAHAGAEDADTALLSRLPADRRARFLKDLRRLVADPETGGKTKGRKKKAARKVAAAASDGGSGSPTGDNP